MAQRTYIALSSENQFGLASIQGGYFDPTVVPTSGGIGQIYIMVSSDPADPKWGLYQKVLTSGIDTNWEKLNNPSDLDMKDAVQVASTGNIPTAGAFPLVVDGVTITAANASPNAAIPYRILRKNQAAPQDNGIFNVTDVGGGNYLLVRSPDADSDTNVTQGLFTWAVLGVVNAETGWILTTPNPIVLGTTPLTFVQAPMPFGAIPNPQQIFVDIVVGSDLAGNGSVTRPYKTIPFALTQVVPATQTVLMLAAGTYAGAPIAWPEYVGAWAPNGVVTITHVCSFTPVIGSNAVTFKNIGFDSPFTIDMTAVAGFQFVEFSSCSVAPVRLTGGGMGTIVKLQDCNIPGGMNIGGTVIMDNPLFTSGPNDVSPGGQLLCLGGVIGVPITVSGTGVINFTACVVPGTITGVMIGPDTPVISSDASSLSLATLAGAYTLNLSDNAPRVAYSPAVPADWAVPPTQVAQALDELAAAVIAAGATYFIEYHTVTAPEIVAKQFLLTHNPTPLAAVAADILGGGNLENNVAFQIVALNIFDFNGFTLDGFLIAGDKIRLAYTY